MNDPQSVMLDYLARSRGEEIARSSSVRLLLPSRSW